MHRSGRPWAHWRARLFSCQAGVSAGMPTTFAQRCGWPWRPSAWYLPSGKAALRSRNGLCAMATLFPGPRSSRRRTGPMRSIRSRISTARLPAGTSSFAWQSTRSLSRWRWRILTRTSSTATRKSSRMRTASPPAARTPSGSTPTAGRSNRKRLRCWKRCPRW